MNETKINSIYLHRLTNGEHFYFHTEVRAQVQPLVGSVAAVTDLFAKYDAALTEEDHVYKRNQKAKETGGIKEADEARDNSLVRITMAIASAVRSVDADIRKAATDLKYILDNYKGTEKASYADESGRIINLLEDLAEADAAAAVATLSLTADVANLAAQNAAFTELYLARAEKKETQWLEGTMRDARKQTDSAFHAFAEALNAAWLYNELAAKDANLRAALEQIFHLINAIIRQALFNLTRRGIKHTPEPPPDPAPDPEPVPEPLPSYPATATGMASGAIRITVPDLPADAVPAGSLIGYTTLLEEVLTLTFRSLSGSVYTFALPAGWGVMGQSVGAPQTVTLRDADNVALLEISNVATRNIVKKIGEA
ncbi:hypothetical protein Barb6XT_03083 [Bacteroidales bacterium Barb6XT]|nr:hypothetical protein Barb6XT_03083 [Bacteroidales bacterium Barb6XT]